MQKNCVDSIAGIAVYCHLMDATLTEKVTVRLSSAEMKAVAKIAEKEHRKIAGLLRIWVVEMLGKKKS